MSNASNNGIMASVIIPTYNRGDKIYPTLKALINQTVQSSLYEIIVIDDGSVPPLDEIVKEFFISSSYKHWKYIRIQSNSGKAAALNRGIMYCSGEILLFTDDDIVPTEHWIEAHVRHYQDATSYKAITGPVKCPEQWIRTSNFVRYHNSRYLGSNDCRIARDVAKKCSISPSHFAGGNFSILKDVLIRVGLFEERMRRGMDGELACRLLKGGVHLEYEKDALVIHYESNMTNYSAWLKGFKRFYVNDRKVFIQKHPDLYNKYCHWFVELPRWGKEKIVRSIVKFSVRLIAKPALGWLLSKVLEKMDKQPVLYFPILYKYVLTCVAIEGIKDANS